MFKSYQPPAQQEDWTDSLLNKAVPLAAGIGAGLAAIPTGGMSLAAIPAVLAAGTTGFGAGQALTGALNSKPGSGARMQQGIGTAMQGASVLNQIDPETGAFKTKEYGTPQVKTDDLEKAKEKAKQASYSSPYAPNFKMG